MAEASDTPGTEESASRDTSGAHFRGVPPTYDADLHEKILRDLFGKDSRGQPWNVPAGADPQVIGEQIGFARRDPFLDARGRFLNWWTAVVGGGVGPAPGNGVEGLKAPTLQQLDPLHGNPVVGAQNYFNQSIESILQERAEEQARDDAEAQSHPRWYLERLRRAHGPGGLSRVGIVRSFQQLGRDIRQRPGIFVMGQNPLRELRRDELLPGLRGRLRTDMPFAAGVYERAAAQSIQEESFTYDTLTQILSGERFTIRNSDTSYLQAVEKILAKGYQKDTENNDLVALMHFLASNPQARTAFQHVYQQFFIPSQGDTEIRNRLTDNQALLQTIGNIRTAYTKYLTARRQLDSLYLLSMPLGTAPPTDYSGVIHTLRATARRDDSTVNSLIRLNDAREDAQQALEDAVSSLPADLATRFVRPASGGGAATAIFNPTDFLANLDNRAADIRATNRNSLRDLQSAVQDQNSFDQAQLGPAPQNPDAQQKKFTPLQLLYMVAGRYLENHMPRGMEAQNPHTVMQLVNLMRARAGTTYLRDANALRAPEMIRQNRGRLSRLFGPEEGLTFHEILERFTKFEQFKRLEDLLDRHPGSITLRDIEALDFSGKKSSDPNKIQPSKADILLFLYRKMQNILAGYSFEDQGKKEDVEVRPSHARYLQNLIRLLQEAWAKEDARRFTLAYNAKKLPAGQGLIELLEYQNEHSENMQAQLEKEIEESGMSWEAFFTRKALEKWNKLKRKEARALPREQQRAFLEKAMADPGKLLGTGLAVKEALDIASPYIPFLRKRRLGRAGAAALGAAGGAAAVGAGVAAAGNEAETSAKAFEEIVSTPPVDIYRPPSAVNRTIGAVRDKVGAAAGIAGKGVMYATAPVWWPVKKVFWDTPQYAYRKITGKEEAAEDKTPETAKKSKGSEVVKGTAEYAMKMALLPIVIPAKLLKGVAWDLPKRAGSWVIDLGSPADIAKERKERKKQGHEARKKQPGYWRRRWWGEKGVGIFGGATPSLGATPAPAPA